MRNIILFAILLASAFQTALGEQAGDWTYTVSNNQATITGYTGAGGAVMIPSEVNGIPVVKAGNNELSQPIFGWNNYSVTSITIPNSITSISRSAFYNCNALKNVTIGNSVTSIKEYAFLSCTGLTSITIPNSVTSIGTGAFRSCYALNNVTIGNSVTSIGDSAFSGCTGLTSITIPNNVTSIRDEAFAYCNALTDVTIDNSAASIGYRAFDTCPLRTFDGGIRFLLLGSGIYLTECSGQESVFSIPSNVNGLPVISFSSSICEYKSNLTSVTIPNSVTRIGNKAFNGCSGLTSITIPNSVTSVGQFAFQGCTSLNSVTMPDRYIAQIAQIGISGQVATDYLVNALANNDAFVTAVANKIKGTVGTYGLATQSELGSLATKSELTSAITESRTAGVNSVLSNPNLWTLYTTSQIQNMAMGDLVLTKQVNGKFALNYDIEQSEDLKTWTTYRALYLPLNGLPTDKAFVRIKAKQEDNSNLGSVTPGSSGTSSNPVNGGGAADGGLTGSGGSVGGD